MTSRERVDRLIRRELNDSFCISVGGMPNDGMSVYAYARLREYLKLPEKPIRVYDLFQFIPVIDNDVIDLLGGDFVHAERPRFRFDLHRGAWRAGKLDDGTPVYFPEEYRPEPDDRGGELVRMDGEIYAGRPKNGLYYDIIRHPLEDVDDTADLRLIHPAVYMTDVDIDDTVRSVEELYRTTDKAVLYHSCGAVFDAIPDFIEMGADMLNPIQLSAAGMDPVKLQETYGRDIIFWGGGFDTQSMRAEDDAEMTGRKAEELLDIFSRTGNYVFTQVHNFQADTPPEKILAVYGAARKKRELNT